MRLKSAEACFVFYSIMGTFLGHGFTRVVVNKLQILVLTEKSSSIRFVIGLDIVKEHSPN